MRCNYVETPLADEGKTLNVEELRMAPWRISKCFQITDAGPRDLKFKVMKRRGSKVCQLPTSVFQHSNPVLRLN